MKEEERITAEAVDLQRRCMELEAVRVAVDAPRRRLVELKDRRLKAEADALLNESTYDVTAISKEIAATEAEIAKLEPKAAVAARALETLTKQLRDKQAELAARRTDAIRTRMLMLENQLIEFVPEFRLALERYKDVIVKMAALALARDRISPQVPGSSGIGAQGLATITTYVPRLRAYDRLGGTLRMDGPAVAEATKILRNLGVRV
jgi:hypothetical protein